MKKEIFGLAIISLLLTVGLASASDEELYIPVTGDEELWMGISLGDEELGLFFLPAIAAPGNLSEGGQGGGGGQGNQCEINDFTCIHEDEVININGTHMTAYDDDCGANYVCYDIIDGEEKTFWEDLRVRIHEELYTEEDKLNKPVAIFVSVLLMVIVCFMILFLFRRRKKKKSNRKSKKK